MEWLIIIQLKNGQIYKLAYANKKERNSQYERICALYGSSNIVCFESTDDNTIVSTMSENIATISINTKSYSELLKLEELRNATRKQEPEKIN